MIVILAFACARYESTCKINGIDYVKSKLNNAQSFNIVEWSEWNVIEDGATTLLTFTASNSFGGIMKTTVLLTFDNDGKVVECEDLSLAKEINNVSENEGN
jgi:hypothetical protein